MALTAAIAQGAGSIVVPFWGLGPNLEGGSLCFFWPKQLKENIEGCWAAWHFLGTSWTAAVEWARDCGMAYMSAYRDRTIANRAYTCIGRLARRHLVPLEYCISPGCACQQLISAFVLGVCKGVAQ